MHPFIILVAILGLLPAVPAAISLVRYILAPIFKLVCELLMLVVLILMTVSLTLIVRVLHLLYLEFSNRVSINPIGSGDPHGHNDNSDGNNGNGNNSSSGPGDSRRGSSHDGSSPSASDNSNLIRGLGSGRAGAALAPIPPVVIQDTFSSDASSEGSGGGVPLRNGHNLLPPAIGKSCHLHT